MRNTIHIRQLCMSADCQDKNIGCPLNKEERKRLKCFINLEKHYAEQEALNGKH